MRLAEHVPVSPSGSELAVTRLQASKKASDWAERRKQALDRAHQIREQRIAEAKVRVVKELSSLNEEIVMLNDAVQMLAGATGRGYRSAAAAAAKRNGLRR